MLGPCFYFRIGIIGSLASYDIGREIVFLGGVNKCARTSETVDLVVAHPAVGVPYTDEGASFEASL
jgi:hypothetical protein